jgi:hypothetical protein
LVALNHFTMPVATSALPFETTETTMSASVAHRKKNPPARPRGVSDDVLKAVARGAEMKRATVRPE